VTARTLIAKENLAFSFGAVAVIVGVAIWGVRLEAKVEQNSEMRPAVSKALSDITSIQITNSDKLMEISNRLSRIEGALGVSVSRHKNR
jgi:hypothetical protein